MITTDRDGDKLRPWDEQRADAMVPTLEDLCASCPDMPSKVREGVRKLEAAAAVCAAGPAILAESRPNSTPLPRQELLEAMATELPGRPFAPQIGRYRLLALLGAGGMGSVYLAHDPQLDRSVAVKVPRLSRAGAGGEPAARRFLREARAAAQVRHPNICPIYDAGQDDETPYLVMAYIPGASLADRLADGPMDSADAVTLCHKVALGLSAVHAAGIIHRDLKPGNILLDAAGEPLLGDFGLALPTQVAESAEQSDVAGTPAYMAPEQALGVVDQIGPWSDVYSLGVVLYELLTGCLPFKRFYDWLSESPLPPSTKRKEVDPGLDAIVLKALAGRPQDRYQSAAELAEALQGWSLLRATLTPSRSRPAMEHVSRWRPAIWVALVGLFGVTATYGRALISRKPCGQSIPNMLDAGDITWTETTRS